MTLDTRVRLVTINAFALLILPGLLMVAGLALPVMVLVEAFLDLAHLPVDGGQPVDSDAARLLNAILGGVLVGFGTLIWRVGDTVFRSDPETGAALIVPAAAAWFVTDSLGSILAGAWFNAVINLAILAALLFPVLWRRRALTVA